MGKIKTIDKIIIIDFGSQVTKLIARRIRELNVYSEILTLKNFNQIRDFREIKGIILSGGPSTVTKKSFPNISKNIFLRKIPILGICYGLQLIAKNLGGKVKAGKSKREFGKVNLKRLKKSLLTKDFFQTKI